MTFSCKVGGHKARVLVDTGSSYNIVSSKFAKSHKIEFCATEETKCIQVWGLGNRPIQVEGRVRLKFESPLYKANITFFVVPTISDVILGQPWLADTAVLDYRDGTVSNGAAKLFGSAGTKKVDESNVEEKKGDFLGWSVPSDNIPQWPIYGKIGYKMKFDCHVGGHKATVLIDSGSTRNVISAEFAKAHDIKVMHRTEMVRGGGDQPCPSEGHATLSFECQLYKATTDITFLVVSTVADVVLGTPWLAKTAVIDYRAGTVTNGDVKLCRSGLDSDAYKKREAVFMAACRVGDIDQVKNLYLRVMENVCPAVHTTSPDVVKYLLDQGYNKSRIYMTDIEDVRQVEATILTDGACDFLTYLSYELYDAYATKIDGKSVERIAKVRRMCQFIVEEKEQKLAKWYTLGECVSLAATVAGECNDMELLDWLVETSPKGWTDHWDDFVLPQALYHGEMKSFERMLDVWNGEHPQLPAEFWSNFGSLDDLNLLGEDQKKWVRNNRPASEKWIISQLEGDPVAY
jgi:hypothetical protein